MDTIYTEGCECSKLHETENYYRDCRELADGPPYSCVHRIARHGKVATAPCKCTTGMSWHLNDTCLRCNQWVKDTLVLVDSFSYYLKAMGTRCYDGSGITFPPLDHGRKVHRFIDNRIPGIKATSQITEVNGRMDIEKMLVLMGGQDLHWQCPWPNMPSMLFFKRLVYRNGEVAEAVCDEAGEVLYELGLIIRPSKDWIPDG